MRNFKTKEAVREKNKEADEKHQENEGR